MSITKVSPITADRGEYHQGAVSLSDLIGEMNSLGMAFNCSTANFQYVNIQPPVGNYAYPVTWRSTTGVIQGYIDTYGIIVAPQAGPIAFPFTTYNATTSDRMIFCTVGAGGITVNLPSCISLEPGFELYISIIDSGAGAVTVTPYSGDTINGASSLKLIGQYSTLHLVSEGLLTTSWVNVGSTIVGTNNMVWGSAAPSTGTWARGDVCWNTGASGGGSPGWVCSAGGTSGTWKTMANLGA
jgi:hypothetical protein